MTESSGDQAASDRPLKRVIEGAGTIRLGGKEFSVVDYDSITALNEHYIMKLMRATGLDVVIPLAEGETDEAYMLRVHAALVDTLKLPDLLAGYLLPLGKTEQDWSQALARDTAKHIAGVSTREDKDEVHRLGLLVTFDFFRAGLDSLRHSRNVLNQMRASPGKPGTDAGGATPAGGAH